jgi:hypothetical protein
VALCSQPELPTVPRHPRSPLAFRQTRAAARHAIYFDLVPFWLSIGLLSLAQGALVALARPVAVPGLEKLRGRRWALVPALSVLGFVFGARAAVHASAQGLTYLALVAVPLGAALALGWLTWGARPARALLVAPLFALAWVDRGGLAGEGAALALSGLSCVALGALIAAVTPPRWLAAGIVAVLDAAFVVSDLLRRPNDALNAAHPAAGLPRLQSAVLGSAAMGYGDLFVAGVLGALLVGAMGRAWQMRGAALTALFALGLDLLFFFVDELPATVPAALTLLALLAWRRALPGTRRGLAPRRSPARAPPARLPAPR